MSRAEAKRLSARWHDLSMVCWCRPSALCSACREQDAIVKQAKAAGWNIFTMQQQRQPAEREVSP